MNEKKIIELKSVAKSFDGEVILDNIHCSALPAAEKQLLCV